MTGLWLLSDCIGGREQARAPSVAFFASFASHPRYLKNMAKSMNNRQKRENGSWEDQDGTSHPHKVLPSQFEPRGNSHVSRKKEIEVAIARHSSIALHLGRLERSLSNHAKKKESEWPWCEYKTKVMYCHDNVTYVRPVA